MRPPGCSPSEGPPLTYFRAAMVVGARSESYRTLRYLVQRLPVMIAPSWLKNATQPIAIDDVIAYLAAPGRARLHGAGGADRRTGRPLLRRDARPDGASRWACGRGRKIPVPFITPWLSALWLGLVTPVDTNVARPLVEGLRRRRS